MFGNWSFTAITSCRTAFDPNASRYCRYGIPRRIGGASRNVSVSCRLAGAGIRRGPTRPHYSLPPILRLRRGTRLPLHVRRIVRAAVLQRPHVIDDPARARAVRLARRRAGVRPAKRFLRMRIARDATMTVASDANVRAARVRRGRTVRGVRTARCVEGDPWLPERADAWPVAPLAWPPE